MRGSINERTREESGFGSIWWRRWRHFIVIRDTSGGRMGDNGSRIGILRLRWRPCVEECGVNRSGGQSEWKQSTIVSKLYERGAREDCGRDSFIVAWSSAGQDCGWGEQAINCGILSGEGRAWRRHIHPFMNMQQRCMGAIIIRRLYRNIAKYQMCGITKCVKVDLWMSSTISVLVHNNSILNIVKCCTIKRNSQFLVNCTSHSYPTHMLVE